MKTAKVTTVKAYYFQCPECEGEIEEPESGSITWLPQELADVMRSSESFYQRNGYGLHTIQCQTCGALVKVPERLTK